MKINSLSKCTFSIVFFLLLNIGNAQKTVFKGTVSGEARPLVKQLQLFLDGKMRIIPVDSANGTFHGSINVSGPQFIEIKPGPGTAEFIYILPDQEVELTISLPNLKDATMSIKEGKISNINDVFKTFYKSLNDQNINHKQYNWVKLLFDKENIAKKALESLSNETNLKKAILPSEFVSDVEIFSKSMLSYVMLEKMSLDALEKELESLKSAPMKLSVLTIPYYREYLVDLSNVFAARKLENYGIKFEAQKEGFISQHIAAEALVKYVPDQKVINFLFFDKINRELAVNGAKNENYINYLMTHADKVITSQFDDKLKKSQANKTTLTKSDRPKAFDFTLQDAEGKKYKLADFKGKVLFIDFWASWCAPCKVQIPHIKNLEKIYAGKDIVFASVSLDKTKQAWLKGVESENLHGTVLWAEGDFKNPFPVAYGVQSIPRFMLIDADGYLITENMPKPQEKKEVMAMLDKEMNAALIKKVLSDHFNAIGAMTLTDNRGLHLEVLRSVMTMESVTDCYFSYPDKLKQITNMKENKLMEMSVGKEFFRPKTTIYTGTDFYSDDANAQKTNWHNNLFGLELFIIKNTKNPNFELHEAEEDNAKYYVISVKLDDVVEKYYIDKSDMLTKKVVKITNGNLRAGGGSFESVTQYSDYKNVEGLTVPHQINISNIITIKVKNVGRIKLEDNIFEKVNE